jgi:hypothetical protein
VVADLDLDRLLHVLGREAAVADEGAALAELEQPQPEASLLVETLVPLDPVERLSTIFRVVVVGHHLGVAEKLRHDVEIVLAHLAEDEACRGTGRRHAIRP